MTVHRRRLVAFVLLALASGWLGLALDRLTGQEPSMESLSALTWILLPAATAIVMSLRGPGGAFAALRPGFRRSGAGSTYATALALFPLVAALTVGLGAVAGMVDADRLDLRRLADQMATTIVPALVKNVAEEVAWRGFLTDQLLREGLPEAVVDVAVGMVWSLWHLPYYLKFLEEDTVRDVLDAPRGVMAAASVPVMTGWAVPFTELFHRSGSIWPTVLAHSVGNTLLVPLAGDGVIRRGPAVGALLNPVFGAVPSALMAGAGWGLRHLRRNRGGGDAAAARRRRLR